MALAVTPNERELARQREGQRAHRALGHRIRRARRQPAGLGGQRALVLMMRP